MLLQTPEESEPDGEADAELRPQNMEVTKSISREEANASAIRNTRDNTVLDSELADIEKLLVTEKKLRQDTSSQNVSQPVS